MRFLAEPWERVAGGVRQSVYLLTSADSAVQAEIWPSLGCNCLRWRVPGPTGTLDLLYVAPDWETNPQPNRSGIPILFPFPNRIRDGRFTWESREYQLPLNDPAGKNAIHGFVCRRPWRVMNTKSAVNLATLTAEFQASVDAPDELHLWPGDYRITMRFLLGPDSLSLSATISNPGNSPLPVGLGYHPYFSVPLAVNAPASECVVTIPAGLFWELEENLPTGRRLPVDRVRDLRSPRVCDELMLDDVYTGMQTPEDQIQLHRRAVLRQPGLGAVEMWTSGSFREMVVFTPPTRKAVCLEPYTCVTDAINLEPQRIDTGLMVLGPGEARTEFVVLRWSPEFRPSSASAG